MTRIEDKLDVRRQHPLLREHYWNTKLHSFSYQALIIGRITSVAISPLHFYLLCGLVASVAGGSVPEECWLSKNEPPERQGTVLAPPPPFLPFASFSALRESLPVFFSTSADREGLETCVANTAPRVLVFADAKKSCNLNSRNSRTREPGDHRENLSTSTIVRYVSQLRKSGSDQAGDSTRFAFVRGEKSNRSTTVALTVYGYNNDDRSLLPNPLNRLVTPFGYTLISEFKCRIHAAGRKVGGKPPKGNNRRNSQRWNAQFRLAEKQSPDMGCNSVMIVTYFKMGHHEPRRIFTQGSVFSRYLNDLAAADNNITLSNHEAGSHLTCYEVQLVVRSFREMRVSLTPGTHDKLLGSGQARPLLTIHYLPKSNWVPVHNVCSLVVTPLESRRATSCGYNCSHPVWHALYECLQDIHGDSSPILLQPCRELSNGFWPRLTSPHPAIQFVPKMFYMVEVGALGGPV
ncbi:hypothetical protein PR048_017853 [Dryococelus australis]|uniref:Uncharacterized protein n=1 Tax=Dryococelus australis TaxID=614101 RepID=A0ABQ9HAM5_9NEOP|nr:hypothetical protein PR048_017853 [Dryococelus australis]